MTQAHDVTKFRAHIWKRVELASERLRLIEGIKRLPKAEREHFAPLIEFLEQEPEEYERFKRNMDHIGFDLRTLMTLGTPPTSADEFADVWKVVVQLARRLANDVLFSAQGQLAASFSTSKSEPDDEKWAGEEMLGEDTVMIEARPDPFGKRVQLSVRIDAPKSIQPGTKLFIALPGPEGPLTAGPVELRGAEERIQGALSVGMAWSDFVARISGEGVVLSNREFPPA